MGEWVDQIHQRAAMLHDQIAAVHRWAPEAKFDTTAAVVPLQKLLEKLYLEELPYARLLDDSDLVIHAEGSATQTDEPRISALTHLLEQLRDESRKLAKVVSGIGKGERVDNIDLLLSGLAHGSLVVGLRVVPPFADPNQGSLLTEDEPVFQAIRKAIMALSEIPHFITEDGVSDKFAEHIPDPAVRDAAIVAVRRLSPTGRVGIDRITLSSPGHEGGVLTQDDRRALNRAIAQPKFRQPARGTFRGEVRELDLDARRFEIRQVKNVGTIRCFYAEMQTEQARKLLGRDVKVTGQYERDPEGRPRLLQAQKITLARRPKTKKLL